MHQGTPHKQPEAALSIGDILAMVRRRLPMILVVAALGMAVGVVVVFLLPDVYEARSVVYVEAARLPATFTKTGAIIPPLSKIVGILRQEALSRSTLQDLVSELDLYEQKAQGSSAGPATFDAVERARKDIKIDLTRRMNDDFVEISARARTAVIAVKAVSRISDVLSSKNQALRLKQEQDAKAFVEGQIITAQRRLQEAESALQRFKEANQESLPENNSMLLDRVSKLRFDKSVAQDRLQKSQLQLLDLQRRVDAIRAGAPAAAADGGGAERRALEAELARLMSDESALESRGYGEGMPSLKRVRASLKRVKEQLAALDGVGPQPVATGASGGAGAAAPAPDDDRVRGLMGQIAETSGVIASIERELEHNAAETARLEMIKASSVQMRSQLAKVEEAADDAATEYKQYANDLRDIEKLIAAEEAGRTDQFRTIEPASLDAAQFPVSPNRPVLLGGALAASLGLGFALGYLLELARPAYREAADLEADLHIDVLASIPEIPDGVGDPVAGRRTPAPAGGAAVSGAVRP